jgi:replicative DNA helicase
LVTMGANHGSAMLSDAPNRPRNAELGFSPHQLPPQNVAAEEAILGGILLDPEALSRITHLLKPEFFYIQSHQDIYRAALSLQMQGKPTDMTAVATWLQDQGLLEKVGGGRPNWCSWWSRWSVR